MTPEQKKCAGTAAVMLIEIGILSDKQVNSIRYAQNEVLIQAVINERAICTEDKQEALDLMAKLSDATNDGKIRKYQNMFMDLLSKKLERRLDMADRRVVDTRKRMLAKRIEVPA